mmetsp:Transcript_11226/g.18551  ORF Transcript_11226/g.18551 Transcript_11226/m.18551 type:complete len:996 (+) Transcript_11226:74-3061(+)
MADENLNISDDVDVHVGSKEVIATSENEREDIVQEVSVQIENSDVEDADVQLSDEVAVDKESNCTEDEQNTESMLEVTEVLEKIVNEVGIANSNEPKLLTTAQDETEGEDAVQNNEQLLSTDLPVTANDAPTKANENKDTGVEQLQTAVARNAIAETPPSKDNTTDASNVAAETPTEPPKDDTTDALQSVNADTTKMTASVGLREILFTDQGWSQLWTAIPDKQLSFTAPVLRVEAGRFFWSSETYNKRVLAIYKQPELILVLRLPVDADEVKRLQGSQASGRSSFLVAESVIDPKTSKIRLSQLTHPTSLPLKPDRSKGIQNIRKRTCFDILTPTEVIELSAAFLPDDSFDNMEYASEKCLSDTFRFEHAISESLLMAQTDFQNMEQHQIILGTPHSYVIGGNDQVLKEALASAFELQKSSGGGNNKLDSSVIDERDTSGNTALHYACRNRRSSTVGILVGAGSNCSIQTADLKTPCHIAALGLDASSLSTILSAQYPRPDPNALDSNLRTPMFVAAVEGRTADGKGNASALDQCLSALEAWGGQLMLGNTTDLHPIHLVQWKSAELGVILSHCHYHYPLLSGLAGISASALYHYPLHGALIHLREQIYLALSSSDGFTKIPSEMAICSRIQTLLIHGFEPNERLEGIFCEGNESKRLTTYFGFTPLQILISAAKEVQVFESSNQKEKDVEYGRAMKNIIEIIHSCAKTLLEKGARLNMPPPPTTRLDRGTSPGCYSLKDAMEGTQKSTIPHINRDGLNKLDNKEILTLLGGADRLKAPQKLFASLPKSVDSVGTLQYGTTSRDSFAPGGSDDCSCAVCWSEFGLISNRKHLCRASGRYVCNDCSTKRVLDNGTEQRITDGLYNLATFEKTTVSGNRKSQVSSRIASACHAASRSDMKSNNSGSSTSTSDRNRSFLGLSSSSSSSATDKKEQKNLSATERITSAISGLGQAKDAVMERGAKLEGLAEKTEALNNASVDFMNMAKELERQQNSWW